MLTPGIVLGARRHGSHHHATRSDPDPKESDHHHPVRPAPFPMRTLTVGQSRQEISDPEENGSGQAEQTTAVPVAQIADDRDGQVLGDFGGDGNGVDLKLAVVETGEKERTVEREGSDGTGTKASLQLVRACHRRTTGRAYTDQQRTAETKLVYRISLRRNRWRSRSITPSTTILSRLTSSRSRPWSPPRSESRSDDRGIRCSSKLNLSMPSSALLPEPPLVSMLLVEEGREHDDGWTCECRGKCRRACAGPLRQMKHEPDHMRVAAHRELSCHPISKQASSKSMKTRLIPLPNLLDSSSDGMQP